MKVEIQQTALATQAVVGNHLLVEMHDCDPQLLNDSAFLAKALQQAAVAANATVLDVVSHQFQPQGATVIVLLAESHISVHTWPEHGYAAVDLFTCGERMDPQKGITFLSGALKSNRVHIKAMKRGSGNE